MTDGNDATTPQNRWRGPFNAWFFAAFDRYINYVTGPNKRAALADLGSSTIVELGSGVGANLDYVPTGSKLIAVEPNHAMHDRLRRRADKAGVELEILAAPGSAIPLPDGSVDEVICTLVLCTVDDPAATLAEVRRILTPGGRFRFVEHVVAPTPGPRRFGQRLLGRPWTWVFEGCELSRDTASMLDQAGFDSVSMSRRKPRRSVFWMVNTQIHGIAVR
ncbi:MAG: class I SAM-dependent methyltransferase [Actinomycetota bacterium]